MPRLKAGAQQAAAPQVQPAAPRAETRSRTRPMRSTRQFHEAAEETIGQDRPRVLKARGKARDALEPATVEAVERPVSNEKLELLKFNEDMLTIMVHDTTNPIDDPVPVVWNDGVSQYFIRGKEQQVKRKFVEVLARSKKTVYSQEKLPDNAGYKNIPHTALKYPFSVISDPSPRGRAWLTGILNEA